MPLYNFYCDNCAIEFELFSKKLIETSPCEQCKQAAKRKLARPAFHSIEGSGAVANEYPTMDRFIGKDAEIRHRINDEKNKARWEVRQNNKQYALEKVRDTVVNVDPMKNNMKNLPTKDDFIQDYAPMQGTRDFKEVTKEDWKTRSKTDKID